MKPLRLPQCQNNLTRPSRLARTLAMFGLLVGTLVQAQTETLKLETWRIEDEARWNKHIIPAFERTHPSTQVLTLATPPTEYDTSLLDKLTKNAAGDLITCRPFDQSLELYNKGHLQDITAMSELRRFRSHSKIAWTTYYADRVFCMPVAAVMTGFFYNTQIFKELNLRPPQTEEALFEVLQQIKLSNKYVPLAFGTSDTWQSAQVLFAGMGPNYWGGEQGRIDLLTGRAKFTDKAYVDAWRAMAKLADYLPKNHKALGENGARKLFLDGKAAIYPAGSWEIPFLSEHSNAKHFGVFAPPPKQTQHNCYVLSHFDLGIGINKQSTHQPSATAFLAWLSTPEFSQLLANNLHGFFPLSNHPVEISNPLAREMAAWRQQCDTTIRINSQFLNQAWLDLEPTLWDVSARVLRKEISPEEAAKHIAKGVEKWFKPI
jgi:raffinose/stachyose/melibiose transport system substrate-binding protein